MVKKTGNTFKLQFNYTTLSTNQQPNQNQPTIDQVIQQMRDDILRTQSTASTAAILGFDKLVDQMRVFASQINDRNIEITRLRELCTKNNIDFAIPPAEPVKLPENKAVTPPKEAPVVTPPNKSK